MQDRVLRRRRTHRRWFRPCARGSPVVHLLARYLKEKMDSQPGDAARLVEIGRILNLILNQNLLSVEVLSDKEMQAPG